MGAAFVVVRASLDDSISADGNCRVARVESPRLLRSTRSAQPFFIQLAFNAAWSWIFFGMRRPGLAFAEILVLWALILATLIAFRREHSSPAGYSRRI
jgi:hypothetical protein